MVVSRRCFPGYTFDCRNVQIAFGIVLQPVCDGVYRLLNANSSTFSTFAIDTISILWKKRWHGIAFLLYQCKSKCGFPHHIYSSVLVIFSNRRLGVNKSTAHLIISSMFLFAILHWLYLIGDTVRKRLHVEPEFCCCFISLYCSFLNLCDKESRYTDRMSEDVAQRLQRAIVWFELQMKWNATQISLYLYTSFDEFCIIKKMGEIKKRAPVHAINVTVNYEINEKTTRIGCVSLNCIYWNGFLEQKSYSVWHFSNKQMIPYDEFRPSCLAFAGFLHNEICLRNGRMKNKSRNKFNDVCQRKSSH